jgi:segregation and condensation protein A
METNIDHDNQEARASVELGSALARIRAHGKFRNQDAQDFVPTPESTFLYIDTPNYDGPLDLLLHLIRKHSMDIFDIPIMMITKKYLEALDQMEALNLDVAGEFLVMAATLAEIKSKMLLPKEERVIDTDEEEGEDPRQELIKRLLVYKSFQEASQELLNRPMNGRDWFIRPAPEQETQDLNIQDLEFKDIVLSPLEIYELVESLHKMLKKSEHISIHTITRDRISVSARLHDLLEFCQIRSNFTLYDALRFFPVYEKIDVIVTFLALLEMSRLKLIKIKNDAQFDLIMTIVKEHFYAHQNEVLNNLAKAEVDYD